MSESLPATINKDASISTGPSGLHMTTLEEMFRFAQYVEKSKMCPQEMKAADIVVAMQTGAELGFSPIRSLVACPVVKGRATVSGEAILALIRRSGLLDPRGDLDVGTRGEGEDEVGWCTSWRRGWNEPRTTTFSYKEAETAGLTKNTKRGEPSMYKKYGQDMLIWRAVGRTGKRYYSDITLGLEVAEIARTLPPPERDITPPTGQSGGQGPDPLLASVIAPGEEIAVASPALAATVSARLETMAAPDLTDLATFEPASQGNTADGLVEMGTPTASPAVDWKPPSVCGSEDPETDGVRCMRAYDHDGPCDWDIDIEGGVGGSANLR